MRFLSIAVTLGLLLVAVWAHVLPDISRPPCDSPDAEAAAIVAQDYLNAQHTHGYKYVLNRIEDIKIISTPIGDTTYFLEVDLLQTECHVLDPTPLANCSVRPKQLTAVEGDCEVVLKKVGGALSVIAFKCKTEESTEDLCLNCPTLLPLNHTGGLDFVSASLGSFNSKINNTFILMEVGRMSSQLLSGGRIFTAEYVIIEANCTSGDCVPLDNAERGFCTAKGLASDHVVNCRVLGLLVNKQTLIYQHSHTQLKSSFHWGPFVFQPIKVPEFGTAASSPALLPVIHAMHGLAHHKLTHFHDLMLSGLLSESTESGELQVMQLAPATVVPADIPLVPDILPRDDVPDVLLVSTPIVPQCPGKIRHY
ncbi:unnamed protein product [Merluccius merluccius]